MQLLVLSPLKENKDAQGDLAELTNIESKELAKFSDAVIASLMTQDGSATGIGYRTDSPDIERQYFHPRAYQYTQIPVKKAMPKLETLLRIKKLFTKVL